MPGRVWLAGGNTTPDPDPSCPGTYPGAVRDGQMRRWDHAPAMAPDHYLTADGRHRATWPELRARFDLLEIPRGRAARGAHRLITTSTTESISDTLDRKAA